MRSPTPGWHARHLTSQTSIWELEDPRCLNGPLSYPELESIPGPIEGEAGSTPALAVGRSLRSHCGLGGWQREASAVRCADPSAGSRRAPEPLCRCDGRQQDQPRKPSGSREPKPSSLHHQLPHTGLGCLSANPPRSVHFLDNGPGKHFIPRARSLRRDGCPGLA